MGLNTRDSFEMMLSKDQGHLKARITHMKVNGNAEKCMEQAKANGKIRTIK